MYEIALMYTTYLVSISANSGLMKDLILTSQQIEFPYRIN